MGEILRTKNWVYPLFVFVFYNFVTKVIKCFYKGEAYPFLGLVFNF